jgi:hypothetical protein
MATYQVRYWFETSSRDKSGEQVSEIIESDSPHAVAKRVQDFMKEDSFTIVPSFGPATNGIIVVNTSHVRYVEVIPSQTPGAVSTAYVTNTTTL